MIHCVIPASMSAEDERKLRAHYADNPNVTVIVDRRRPGSDRRLGAAAAPDERRVIRDRRRARVPGSFPHVHDAA